MSWHLYEGRAIVVFYDLARAGFAQTVHIAMMNGEDGILKSLIVLKFHNF